LKIAFDKKIERISQILLQEAQLLKILKQSYRAVTLLEIQRESFLTTRVVSI